MKLRGLLVIVCLSVSVSSLSAADWSRFRGPNGSGVSESESAPTEWSDTKNIKWKQELPGAGSSSPIVVGDKVFVVCYSGYGTRETRGAEQSELRRHIVCINRTNGEILWKKTIEPVLPEDRYSGFLAEHGYASNTPVSDGENVYVFLGKTGVFAFDMKGNQLWQKSVGTESGNRRWGSAASLLLHKNMVIVPASEESMSLRAFDKKTGEEIWKAEAGGFEMTWSTPILVDNATGGKDLAIITSGEVWGLNADTGKLSWYAGLPFSQAICTSLIHDNGIVYAVGGRSGGAAAIKVGGKGDVTDTHVLWTLRKGSYVTSPVLHDGHLYWVSDRGIALCVDAKTGEVKYEERLQSRGGRIGLYASPVLVGGKLYAVTRTAGTYILDAKPEFKQLTHNAIESDSSQFNATPAIVDGQIFLRSDKYLYCIGE